MRAYFLALIVALVTFSLFGCGGSSDVTVQNSDTKADAQADAELAPEPPVFVYHHGKKHGRKE